jgi:hypothetical protein
MLRESEQDCPISVTECMSMAKLVLEALLTLYADKTAGRMPGLEHGSDPLTVFMFESDKTK